jgi:glycosyltransferase involved in cell wall biosynthesis
LKVIHILRRLVEEDWGGAEAVVYNYCTRLIGRGYDVPIYCTSALGSPGPAAVRGLAIERFKYFYPYLFLSAENKLRMDKKGGSPISMKMFSRLLREKGVDLVHLHSVGRLGAMVRTVCRLRGIPYVVSLHGGYFMIPAAELADIGAPADHALELGKPFGLIFGTRRVLTDAAAVLNVGYDEHVQVMKNVSGKTSVYLPNGVDTARFATGDGARFRKKYGFEGKRLVMCISRIDPQKGQIYLAQALPGLLQQVPDAHLVIIGSITVKDYHDEIVATLKKEGVENHATIIAGLPPDTEDLIDAYSACDVFALATRHEPFGIVVLEAWAAHRPVVAARIGGIPHFCTHNENALLFEPNSVPELTGSLARVLKDSALAQRLADNGMKEARRSYDWEAIVDRLTEVYARAVKRESMAGLQIPEGMPENLR